MTTDRHNSPRGAAPQDAPLPSETLALAAACHPACLACRPASRGGLGLRFEVAPDGAVSARFECASHYQGYPDRLHGGVVATLLDAAMTHCLFSRGVRGVTARLNIRYRHPVDVGTDAVVRAWLVRDAAPLYVLRAEIHQEDRLRALAEAKFFAEPARPV